MSVKQRMEHLEKKLTELTGKPGERGSVIIIRSWPYTPDAVLTGYRDHTGAIWPLDQTQWPVVPPGGRMVLKEVWSDDEKAVH